MPGRLAARRQEHVGHQLHRAGEPRGRVGVERWLAQQLVAADVRPDVLGAEFELSGGHIRAAVLRAAYRAAALGQPVAQRLLAEAALIELEGLGKLVPAQGSQRKPR